MNKLTIKEIAPYLPYGLKAACLNVAQYGLTKPLIKELEASNILTLIDYDPTYKPILRPLSDLTKEILHNGEKFVPVEWLEEKYYTLGLHKQCEKLAEDSRWVNHSDYLLIIHLLEWHFDIFGLLEKGLAIDINTLKNEN
jgi:hypothetical protein